jgi:hypothetical protein
MVYQVKQQNWLPVIEFGYNKIGVKNTGFFSRIIYRNILFSNIDGVLELFFLLQRFFDIYRPPFFGTYQWIT